jgi:hypothetical protein
MIDGPEIIDKYDFVLFFAPVWMGHVAYPLRRYLKHLKKNPKQYGFLSISGGSMGENTKLPNELLQRTGMEPAILLDQHIEPLFPPGSDPALMKVATYQINEEDLKKLTDIAVDSIRKVLFPDNN